MGVLSRRRSTSVLAQADALAGEGRGLDAIAALSAENRRRRDPDLEAELVRLRLRAFAEIRASCSQAHLPAVDDAFPAAHDVIPEVMPSDLNAGTLRSAIQHHGSLLVRGLVPASVVTRLRDGIDRTLAARSEWSPTTEPSPWYEPFSGDGIDAAALELDRAVGSGQGAVLVADSPRALFDLVESYRALGIGSILEEYFGERPVLSARKATLRRARASEFFDAIGSRGVDSGWHQDGAFLGADVRTVNVWVALSECGRDAPSLDVVARRVDQLLPRGTEGAVFDWAASSSVVQDAGAGAIVRPDFAPGDAMFFDGMCVHQTGAAPTMTKVRYAIETWFFAPSTFPLQWVPLAF